VAYNRGLFGVGVGESMTSDCLGVRAVDPIKQGIYSHFGFQTKVTLTEQIVGNEKLNVPLLTDKQWRILYNFIKGKTEPNLFFEGSVSSGKTFLQCVLFGILAQMCDKNDLLLVAGYSLTTVEANIVEPLRAMWGKNFKCTSTKAPGRLFGVKVEFRGASDIRSEDSIRGITLKGGLIDEGSICNKAFFDMFMTRLRANGAWSLIGTNPDAPGHWIYKDYADKGAEIGWSCFHFKLRDNTFLDEAYIQRMEKMFSGVFYDRFILGLRVSAEGSVYKTFHKYEDRIVRKLTKKDYDNITYTVMGIDFGGSVSKTALTICGFGKNFDKFYVIDELLIDSKNLIVQEMYDAASTLINRAIKKPQIFYYDNMETVLGNTLGTMLWDGGYTLSVEPCVKEAISNRLWFNNFMIENDGIIISDTCIEYIDSMRGAVYDKKGERMDIGKDNPFCVDIQDSVEYCYQHVMSILQYGILDMTLGVTPTRKDVSFSHLFKNKEV
jgi:Terminase-like family.